MGIAIGVVEVLPDEPCFALVEMNLQSPGSRGWHRYRILYVLRGDRLAEYREDMGLIEDNPLGQFRIVGGVYDTATGKGCIVHTVAELRDIAAQFHARRGKVVSGPGPVWESPEALMSQWVDHAEQRSRWRRNQTTAGRYITVQRSN